MLTPKHQKGVLNEQRAILYLMKKGFTVFSNVFGRGLIDLIAIKNNTVKLFDVKSVSKRKSGKKKGTTIYRVPTKQQKDLGVELLFVDEQGNCKMREDKNELSNK